MKAAEIINKACNITNLGPFPNASYHEGLEFLVEQINQCNAVTEKSLQVMEREMVSSLCNRLRVEDYLLRHPEVLEEKIEKPVFVFGIPRTGTTFTNHLLGSDPARRSLLNWESTQSIPPATTETLRTDPRCVEKRAQQQKMLDDNPGVVLPHWEWADDPTECIFLLAQDFKALSWEARLPMPGYSKWILECDVTSAYEYHKKVLQILQSKAPGIWNLKMPSHAVFVPTLMKVYPDARLIWTHRDPYQTFASSCSLNRFTQSMTGIEPDPIYIGDNATRRLGAHLQGAMAGKKSFGENAIYDIHYKDLMRDPIAEMRKLYDWLGDDFTHDIESAMGHWIDSHPKNQFGKHKYTLEEFGQSRESLSPIFDDYVEQYGLAG
jgi:hypothetical protein